MNLKLLSEKVGRIAREVGAILAEECKRWKEIPVEKKEGGDNPGTQVVTEVDRRLEGILKEELMRLLPDGTAGWLGEEGGDDGSRLMKDMFWCVDPLDGTQAFIGGKPGISISIALVGRDGASRLGTVFDPISDALYSAYEGGGCWKNDEKIQVNPQGNVTVLWDGTWRRHTSGPAVKESLLGKGWMVEDVPGGAVMNVVSLLDGAKGCYFKFPKQEAGGGSLWDFAATVCLIKEAVGVVTDMSGHPLCLNPKDTTFMNKSGVLYATNFPLSKEIQELYKSLS